MLVVAWPLSEYVHKRLPIKALATHIVEAFVNVGAAECAHASPVVVVSLRNIPLLTAQHFNVSGAQAVAGDDGSFVGLVARERVVRRSDLVSRRELVKGASVALAFLEGLSDHVRNLGKAQENVCNVEQQVPGV